MSQDERAALLELLASLTAELADRKAALPAHSGRRGQVVEIESLEEQVLELKQKVEELDD